MNRDWFPTFAIDEKPEGRFRGADVTKGWVIELEGRHMPVVGGSEYRSFVKNAGLLTNLLFEEAVKAQGAQGTTTVAEFLQGMGVDCDELVLNCRTIEIVGTRDTRHACHIDADNQQYLIHSEDMARHMLDIAQKANIFQRDSTAWQEIPFIKAAKAIVKDYKSPRTGAAKEMPLSEAAADGARTVAHAVVLDPRTITLDHLHQILTFSHQHCDTHYEIDPELMDKMLAGGRLSLPESEKKDVTAAIESRLKATQESRDRDTAKDNYLKEADERAKEAVRVDTYRKHQLVNMVAG